MADSTPTIYDPPNAVHILQPTTDKNEHWFVGDNLISDGIVKHPTGDRSKGWDIEITPVPAGDGYYRINNCLYFIIIDPAWVFKNKNYSTGDNKQQAVVIDNYKNGAEDFNITATLYNEMPDDVSYQNRVLELRVQCDCFSIKSPNKLPSFSMRFNAYFNGVTYESPDPTMVIRDPR